MSVRTVVPEPPVTRMPAAALFMICPPLTTSFTLAVPVATRLMPALPWLETPSPAWFRFVLVTVSVLMPELEFGSQSRFVFRESWIVEFVIVLLAPMRSSM